MEEKNQLQKAWKFLKSMKFGLALLLILGVISIVGSIIPQGRELSFYQHTYSPSKANLIMALQIDDIYHSFYFVLLCAALSINLFLCSVVRIESIRKKMAQVPKVNSLEKMMEEDVKQNGVNEQSLSSHFKLYGFNQYRSMNEGNRKIYYGKKNTIGYMGSWLIHLGVLAIILAYGYGQFTYYSTAVYGVPGSIQPVEETDLKVKIQDFKVQYREDGSVEQYISSVDLLGAKDEVIGSTDIYVNKPMRYNGYSFYQNSTGWAANLSVFREGEKIAEQTSYETTAFVNHQDQIAIQFTKMFPDFIATERGLFTQSNHLNNPMILYAIFFRGTRVVMNVIPPGEMIEWNEYGFLFEEPQMYTYLQVNKMRGKVSAMIGSLLMMAGLVLAFYVKPKSMVVVEEGNKLMYYVSKNTRGRGFNVPQNNQNIPM